MKEVTEAGEVISEKRTGKSVYLKTSTTFHLPWISAMENFAFAGIADKRERNQGKVINFGAEVAKG